MKREGMGEDQEGGVETSQGQGVEGQEDRDECDERGVDRRQDRHERGVEGCHRRDERVVDRRHGGDERGVDGGQDRQDGDERGVEGSHRRDERGVEGRHGGEERGVDLRHALDVRGVVACREHGVDPRSSRVSVAGRGVFAAICVSLHCCRSLFFLHRPIFSFYITYPFSLFV